MNSRGPMDIASNYTKRLTRGCSKAIRNILLTTCGCKIPVRNVTHVSGRSFVFSDKMRNDC